MNVPITGELPRKSLARMTGGVYLGFILTTALADVLGHIGMGQAPQVYKTIVSDAGLFRLALVIAFLSALIFLVAAWGLYALLRPVNRDVALLFLLLNAVGVGVQCASTLPLVSAMLLADPASTVRGYSEASLEGLAYLAIDTYKMGFIVAQLFFGTWLFPLGYLVYKSTFLPRFLGILLMCDGIGVLIWFIQSLLLPSYPAITYPGLAVSFVAEVGLGLWLLVKGVKIDHAAG